MKTNWPLATMPTTAYEREQTALHARIEQLEREVRRLVVWARPPSEMCLVCGTGFVSREHAATHTCAEQRASGQGESG